MKRSTIERLNRINRDFYCATAAEFDAARQVGWRGWERLLAVIDRPLRSVLDLGCGNGRFAGFLVARQSERFAYTGIDSSADLLARARRRLIEWPNIEPSLIEADIVLDGLPRSEAELVALFGLIHHVPGFDKRRELLAAAAQSVLPGGFLVFAAWRFYERARFRERILPWPAGIEVEKHDYLLDWRRGERALRYCHYVDDAEHAQLIEATGLTVIADYRADGAERDLNRYTILQKVQGGAGLDPPRLSLRQSSSGR